MGAVEGGEGGGDEGSVRVVLSEEADAGVQRLWRDAVGAGEEEGGGGGDLVLVEGAKILHIEGALAGVHHRHHRVDFQLIPTGGLVDVPQHVGELGHAGWLDEDAIRFHPTQDGAQGAAKVARDAAADAAGSQLGDGHVGALEKGGVHVHITVLVLHQHDLFVRVAFLDELFDERCLSGSEKTGKNGYLSHGKPSS